MQWLFLSDLVTREKRRGRKKSRKKTNARRNDEKHEMKEYTKGCKWAGVTVL